MQSKKAPQTLQNKQIKQKKRVVRVVAISDTHAGYEYLSKYKWPPADLFIHAGDITNNSEYQQFEAFRKFLTELPYKHKVVIGGNHDFGLEATKQSYQKIASFSTKQEYQVDNIKERQKLKQICHFLDHQYIEIDGIKIFGSPYIESTYLQGFVIHPDKGVGLWSKVPENIDILITHNPPNGILDRTGNVFKNVGSRALRTALERIKPKVHVFGHIHEGHGNLELDKTCFYNVSVMDKWHRATHQPTLIQFEI